MGLSDRIQCPQLGDYLVITDKVSPSDLPGKRWQHIGLHLKSAFVPAIFILEPGEWYQIKNILVPKVSSNTAFHQPIVIRLALDSSSRTWVKEKLSILAGSKDYRISSRTVTVNANDLNGRAIVLTHLQDAVSLADTVKKNIKGDNQPPTRWDDLEC
jgi:hypothetical protein